MKKPKTSREIARLARMASLQRALKASLSRSGRKRVETYLAEMGTTPQNVNRILDPIGEIIDDAFEARTFHEGGDHDFYVRSRPRPSLTGADSFLPGECPPGTDRYKKGFGS